MIKKKYNTDLFGYLNWIVKKTKKEPSEQEAVSIFITNRWLSMVDSTYAKIVNVTFNRWLTKNNFLHNNLIAGKFFKTVLPFCTKKFNYIKGESKNKETEDSESELIAKASEISLREINLYNHTLEVLGLKVK